MFNEIQELDLMESKLRRSLIWRLIALAIVAIAILQSPLGASIKAWVIIARYRAQPKINPDTEADHLVRLGPWARSELRQSLVLPDTGRVDMVVVMALAALQDQELPVKMLPLLRSQSALVRESAIFSMERAGDYQDNRAFRNSLDPNVFAKREGVLFFAQSDLISALKEMADKDPDGHVRSLAAALLATMGGRS